MKRFLILTGAFVLASPLFAERITHEAPAVAFGPPATVADMLASQPAPRTLGAFPGGSYSFNPSILVTVVINAAGRNGTFFRTDYFLVNGRGVPQEILVGFLAAGVTNAGAPAQRFVANANTAYAIDDYLGMGTGRLNQTGVGSHLDEPALRGWDQLLQHVGARAANHSRRRERDLGRRPPERRLPFELRARQSGRLYPLVHRHHHERRREHDDLRERPPRLEGAVGFSHDAANWRQRIRRRAILSKRHRGLQLERFHNDRRQLHRRCLSFSGSRLSLYRGVLIQKGHLEEKR